MTECGIVSAFLLAGLFWLVLAAMAPVVAVIAAVLVGVIVWRLGK